MTAPGETLKETLANMDYTQVQLAERLDISYKHLSNIINGKAVITSELALKLDYILDIPSSFWNSLEKNYQEYIEEKKQEELLDGQVEWVSHFPYNELVKLGYVPKIRDAKEKVKQLLKFFGYSSFEIMKKNMDSDELLAGAFRLSVNQGEVNKYALKTWVQIGDNEIRKIDTKDFSKETALKSIEELRSLTLVTDPSIFIPRLKEVASSFGVAVVLVPEIKGSKVCGLTRWLSPYPKAAIQLSLRYKQNDHLWFTFFHELSHILFHNKKPFYTFVKAYKESEEEIFSDKWAADTLIPPQKLSVFLRKGTFTYESVRVFADNIGIHPGIVVGRLQKEKVIGFDKLNSLKVRYKWNE
ncbi:XRE family transcriptional regulator [Enterococcus devriesei]|uniref:XRE family transcriptional regulator n=1 Tax=Enterococcus devriesei TaxID=319970 RepID=A0A1L8SVM9_9ENTE|nr:XRE family transcriptional regulator [Enterococcus devriesei]